MKALRRIMGMASPTVLRNVAAGLSGSVLGVGVNGAYTILLARALDPEVLGGVSALFGVTSIVALTFSAVQISTSREVAMNLVVFESRSENRTWTRQVLTLGMLGAMSWPVAAIPMAEFLKLGYWEVASIAPVFMLAAGLSLEFGKIHGSGRVTAWMVLAQVGTIMKLLFVAVVIVIQRSVISVSLAVSLSMIIILLTTRTVSRKIRTPSLKLFSKPFLISFVSIGVFASLVNIDVVIARAVLNVDESGQYAILSLFYKTLASIFGVVGVVIFPKFASVRTQFGSINTKVRLVTLVMTIISLLLAYPIGMACSRFISVLLGPGYDVARSSLVTAAIVAVPWTGVHVAVHCRLVEVTWRLTVILLSGLFAGSLSVFASVETVPAFLRLYGTVGVVILFLLLLVPTHRETE